MDDWQREAGEQAAIALMRAGNHRGAEARLRTLLAAHPNDARALALLARCRFADNDKAGGVELARSATAINPADPLVRSTLALALERATGDKKKLRKEALELAEDVAAENPQDAGALFSLAVARWNASDDSKATPLEQLHARAAARDMFDDAERLAQDTHDLINVANLRLWQWDYSAAESLARRAITLDPTQAEAFRILADCALYGNRMDEARDMALEALRLEPMSRKALQLIARARIRSRPWLKPFSPIIDWVMEMDRSGLLGFLLILFVVVFVFFFSIRFDISRIEAGVSPVLIVSIASGLVLLYMIAGYGTAIVLRLRIRRDLRRLSLPDF